MSSATEMLQEHGYVIKAEEKRLGIRRCAWIFTLALAD